MACHLPPAAAAGRHAAFAAGAAAIQAAARALRPGFSARRSGFCAGTAAGLGGKHRFGRRAALREWAAT